MESFEADAGVTFRKGVGADDHHRAHDLGGQFRTCSNSVAEDDVLLQFFHVRGWDKAVLKSTKTCGDTVGDAPFTDVLRDRVGRPLDARNGFGRKRNLCFGVAHGLDKLFERK